MSAESRILLDSLAVNDETSTDEVRELLEDDVRVVDVRDRASFGGATDTTDATVESTAGGLQERSTAFELVREGDADAAF